jgi:AcrR family transcriptional regulator
VKHDTESNLSTRERILEAAGEIFADYGFRCATVRKICEQARVNVAAINYHFHSKEELYSEVLKYWHEFAIKKYPLLFGVGKDAPSEDQLRAFIRSLLFRMLDKGKPAWFGKVMAREMVEPTPAFDRLLEESIHPLNKLLGSIVRKIIGTPVNEDIIRLCCASILSQCFYYYNTRAIRPIFQRDMSNPEEIEGIADHIMRFSLKGVKNYMESAKMKGSKKSSLGGE